jgi:hypothetical protein
MRRTVLVLALFIVIASLGIWSTAQTSGFFQRYPGGTTHAVYQINDPKLTNPLKVGFDVQPASGDQLTVTTTNQITASRAELDGGVAEGVAAAQLAVNDPGVQALMGQQLQIGINYVLPNGTRFSADQRATIVGLSVIEGTLTDPQKPDQRTQLAFADGDAALTLPFPPLIQTQKLQNGQYQTTFSLQLIEYTRQP